MSWTEIRSLGGSPDGVHVRAVRSEDGEGLQRSTPMGGGTVTAEIYFQNSASRTYSSLLGFP